MMNQYLKILEHIHGRPQCFQSDHFRAHASLYAEAASRGHISCVFNNKNVGKWRITEWGLTFLRMSNSLSLMVEGGKIK